MFIFNDWQGKEKRTAFSGLGFHPYFSTQVFYISFSDGKAQSGSFINTCIKIVGLHEPFKNQVDLVRMNASAGVFYIKEQGFLVFLFTPEFNLALICKFNGILNQVGQDGIQFAVIRNNGTRVTLARDEFKLQAFSFCLG